MKVMKVKSLSRLQLFATPWTVAYQASPSMGFSREEYWSGVPLPSPKKNVLLMFKFLLFWSQSQHLPQSRFKAYKLME